MKERNKKMIGVLFVITIIQSSFSLAYIDPGTGGMIAGSIWPMVVGILTAIGGFCVRYFFKPIKKTILKICGKNENK